MKLQTTFLGPIPENYYRIHTTKRAFVRIHLHFTSPFCCPADKVVPRSFSYISLNINMFSKHVPLANNRSCIPLVSSLIASAINGQVYTEDSEMDSLHKESMQRWMAIVRVAIRPAGTGGGMGGKPAGKENVKGKKDGKGDEAARYFVPFGDDKGQVYKEDEKDILMRSWKEISQFDAEICLKTPYSRKQVIGDGELWTLLEGKETIFCDKHQNLVEMMVWVRGETV